MKQLITLLFLVVLIEAFTTQCANPLRPTGGPKDTIPPSLLLSQPVDQTINFKGQELHLYFDEYINADKIQQKLTITPNTNIKYKHTIKRRDLIIKFEEPFKDSTTYTLNFDDGVTDITEKNPVPNLILAFSTGSYIDSLRVIGSIRDLYTNKPSPKTTVGLYPLTDTLDIFLSSPYYFVNTIENGSYELRNIKAGKYRIVAFEDENKNLKLDAASESYAFLKDTINPSSQPDSIHMFKVKLDASKLKFIAARPAGKYFDIRYSKKITSYTIKALDSLHQSYHSLNTESDAIHIYNHNNLSEQDSTGLIVSARDSIGNTSIDTVYAKFRTTARKPIEYKYSLLPNSGVYLDEQTQYQLVFNKPSVVKDSSFLSFPLDSLYSIPISAKNLSWNSNQTILSFNTTLTQALFQDTLQSLIDFHQPDTLNIDTATLIRYNLLTRIPKTRVQLNIATNSFQSVESDTLKAFNQKYEFIQIENFGTINLKLNTTYTSYIVQLLTSTGEVVTQQPNCSNCKFEWIKPGDYSIRIMLDDNNNGKWETANILKLQEPETIIHFPKQSALRANWSIELEYSF